MIRGIVPSELVCLEHKIYVVLVDVPNWKKSFFLFWSMFWQANLGLNLVNVFVLIFFKVNKLKCWNVQKNLLFIKPDPFPSKKSFFFYFENLQKNQIILKTDRQMFLFFFSIFLLLFIQPILWKIKFFVIWN